MHWPNRVIWAQPLPKTHALPKRKLLVEAQIQVRSELVISKRGRSILTNWRLVISNKPKLIT